MSLFHQNLNTVPCKLQGTVRLKVILPCLRQFGDGVESVNPGDVGLPEEGHFCLFGGAVAFVLVARLTGARGIVPGIPAPAGAREQVIHGKIAPGQAFACLPVAKTAIAGAQAAEDTAIIIALKHGFFAPGNAMAGNLNVPAQADHGGQVKDALYAVDGQEMIRCRFDPFTHQEGYSPLVCDDGEGFVRSVEK